MAEEQRSDQSNGPILCADNCGFYGNPATLNLCSKCYRRWELETLHKTTKADKTESSSAISAVLVEDVVLSSAKTDGPSRCSACRKRVGLTGFKCKCGSIYCGSHRYPETHSCSFDFKRAGKEAIAKANPVTKAAKLDKKI